MKNDTDKDARVWRPIGEAPCDEFVLLAWGTRSRGPLGYCIAWYHEEKWLEPNREQVEEGDYVAMAWMPLPLLPLPQDLALSAE